MKNILIRVAIWTVGLALIAYMVPFVNVTSTQNIECITAPCNPIISESKLTLGAYMSQPMPAQKTWFTPQISSSMNYVELVASVALLVLMGEVLLFGFRKKRNVRRR